MSVQELDKSEKKIFLVIKTKPIMFEEVVSNLQKNLEALNKAGIDLENRDSIDKIIKIFDGVKYNINSIQRTLNSGVSLLIAQELMIWNIRDTKNLLNSTKKNFISFYTSNKTLFESADQSAFSKILEDITRLFNKLLTLIDPNVEFNEPQRPLLSQKNKKDFNNVAQNAQTLFGASEEEGDEGFLKELLPRHPEGSLIL